MIHRLPITMAHDTPVNKNHPSTPQIVTCKNPIPYSSPHKEGNTPRSLNLPNTFPKKDNGQGVSQLIVNERILKAPFFVNFHRIRSPFTVGGRFEPKVQRNSSTTLISQLFGLRIKRKFQLLRSSIPNHSREEATDASLLETIPYTLGKVK